MKSIGVKTHREAEEIPILPDIGIAGVRGKKYAHPRHDISSLPFSP
jgi:hypothetical protein